MGLYRVETEIAGPTLTGPGLSVMHFEAASDAVIAGAKPELVNLWSAWASFIVAGYQFNCASRILDLTTGVPRVVSEGNGQVVNGQSGGQAVPRSAQAICTWKTALATRAGRGRTYIPGIAIARVVSGNLDPATQANMDASAETFLFSDPATDPLLAVYHRLTGTYTDVTGAFVRPYFAVLRSRRD